MFQQRELSELVVKTNSLGVSWLLFFFNTITSRKERWLYLNINRNVESQLLYIVWPVKNLTTRYYGIYRKCIYNRYLYFTGQLLNRKSQNHNKGAIQRFHLIKEVNYLIFYFTNFFLDILPSQGKTSATIGVPEI